jgi:3-oxoacyl-[acyl-carrier protein] reductase
MPQPSLVPEHRAAIVTGASRGIGGAIAIRLARDGFAVAGCFTRPSPAADKVRAEVEAAGVPAYFAPCDVRDAEAVEEFVSAAERAAGKVTVLVNNAGITRDQPLVLMPPADWEAVIATNLTGTWNFCRTVAFRLIKRGGGAVVNISSIAGVYGNAGQANYAAAKAGIIGLSKSLAKEVGRFGIRVNVVAPGFITSDMTDGLSDAVRAEALA